MTVMAAPSEALVTMPQAPPGPSETRPPDGPGFHSALEDSLARTATAEGQQERQSASDIAGGQARGQRDGASETSPEALTSAGPASGASTPGSAANQSNPASAPAGTAGASSTAGGKAHGHGKGQPRADAQAATSLVPQSGTASAEISTAVANSAAEPADSQTQPEPAATSAGPAAPAPAHASAAAANLAPGQPVPTGAAIPSQPAPSAATTTAAPAAPDAQLGPVAPAPADSSTGTAQAAGSQQPGQAQASIQPATVDLAPATTPASSTATSTGALAPATGEGPAPAGETGAQATGSAPANLRMHLPWLDSAASGGPRIAGAGNLHASSTPLSEGATQARPGSTATMRIAQPSRSTAAGGHLALALQSGTGAQTAAATQSGGTGEGGVQGASSSPTPWAAPAGGTQALPFTYGANMQETIETIHATVALASRQGAAQAQISLEPAELGAVRIHLTQTAEGLVARVSAETVAGAQAIASGQSELHSTLSSLGISLLRLDVGSFTQQQAQAGGQSQQRAQQPARSTSGTGPEVEEIASTSLASTVSLSSTSALVDVLA